MENINVLPGFFSIISVPIRAFPPPCQKALGRFKPEVRSDSELGSNEDF